MDEIWERAVETALNGQKDYAATRTLTLDGAVKAVPGRLPPPSLLEKFENLQHLSIANNGVPSLEHFPRLRNLQKLILSDNRIGGGLEYLVEAGLESLRDLDLSNNRIQYIEDLAPLAQLKLVSLDLYECPVTKVRDYRSRVFGLIKSLKYLDNMDADENERPDSDEEEEDEEDEDEDDEDTRNEEIEGEDRGYKLNNGHREAGEGIIEVNDDEESDTDEEEMEASRQRNGYRHEANGFRVEEVREDRGEGEGEGEDEDEDEEDYESGEEVDDEDDDVVEVHEIEDSDDEDEEDEDEEEVDNDEGDFAGQEINGLLTSTEGEIDGHEQGEDDGDDDDIGETGEEEQGVDDGEFEDEEVGDEEDDDDGEGYLIQPGRQSEEHDAGVSDMDSENEEDDTEEEAVDDEDDDVQVLPASSHLKRKRGDDDDNEDEDGEDEDEDEDVDYSKSSKKHC